MSYPAATTGVGTAAQIAVDSTFVTLSLGGVNTHQITAQVEDVAGTPQVETVFTLTAVANASGNTSVYTGTITGGGSNAFAGFAFEVAGFTNAVNNGAFVCTASSGTTLTLDNSAGVSETHAATATSEDTVALTYIVYGAQNIVSGTPTGIATVSATGLITGVATGQTTVEVSYPAFNNTVGSVASSGNVMNGTPQFKVYKLITVQVTP